MDKFTVDLDQVLNDFEYSELTDQYNASRNADTNSSSSNQNISKHSINNVFHSLNEYLNTNINTHSLRETNTNLKDEDNFIVKEVDIEDAYRNHNLQSARDIENTCRVEETDHQEKRAEGFANETIKEEITNCDSSSVQVSDKTITNLGSFILNKHIIDEDVAKEDIETVNDSENLVNISEESIPKAVENCSIKTDEAVGDLIGTFNDCDLSEGTIQKYNESEVLVEQVADNLVSIENEEITSNSEIENKCDQIVVQDFYEAKEISTKVGFEDELNLDDNEIIKLLADLEEDEELKVFKENESHFGCELNGEANIHKNISEQSDAIVITESAEQEMKKESLKLSQAELKINIEKNELIVPISEIQMEEEPFKIEEVNANYQEHSGGKEMEGPSNIENSVSNQEVCDEKKIEVDQQSLDKIVVIVEPEVCEDKSTLEDGDQAIVNDKPEKKNPTNEMDSLSRPQNLSLKGEGDEPKREINLIGDPGSTPYNNIYINKEIHKHETNDSDTDCSISSNTFSDASSTASTASTEEIRDEHEDILIDKKEIESANSTSANVTSEVLPIVENISKIPVIGNDNDDEEEYPTENVSSVIQTELTIEAESESNQEDTSNLANSDKQWLGKEAPLWIPDSDALSCLHCDMRFTVLKRRHHCRACGLVLCSKCCHLRFRLEYLDAEARVCNKCHDILNKDTNSSSSSDLSPDTGNSPSHRPNPNNPLEYCSTVSPLEQAANANTNPPAVMVPVGVLKRKGSNKGKSNKSVMFCDGIRPGSDLTNLDNDFNYNNTKTKKLEKNSTSAGKINRNLPIMDSETKTFIPANENNLPPLVTVLKTDISYTECANNPSTVEILKNEQLTFAIHLSLHVHVKIIDMSCCINKSAWCFSTEGLINVGQDEIVILLEYIDEESFVPKDVFYHLNNLYNEAVKGTSVKELGLSLHNSANFLDSKNHAGFVYIRPTFQCLENIIKPKDPYLIGILIHRWETPWAKLFPLRLILRLGAEYRYYPSPIISTRHRDSVFVEIGHTIINLLADFRNFSYTLPEIRGLTIHMEDKNTTVTIPINRYDQVIKSMNNSSDHILAFAGNFSQQADSHLVCIQDTQGNENCYSTHAINIHNKPRKITGASFIVFNGALKSTSGLTAKSNIVEDGLMIQVLPEHMQQIRDNLRAMKNHTIACGCVNADSDETVNIVWGENDVNFNIGVTSAIDNMSLGGVPSIRVHNGKNHMCVNGSRIIRWTEVFIIQNGDDSPKNQDPVDISRVSESIAKATCEALVKYLDLLLANNFQKIGIRTTLHVENVSYCAGSNGTKLPPIYMKSLDNELIPVLHQITSNNLGESAIVLELIFRILNV